MSKISILVGSHRNDSQSKKIGDMMRAKLSKMDAVTSVSLVDVATADLPLWQESYSEDEAAQIQRVGEQLREADAFIVIAPEWNGMVPAGLKNLFLLYSANEFAHKPALIASVSAGIGGSYPITELRSTTYKNSRICYLPEHLIFRNVESMFNQAEEAENKDEQYMSARTDYCLDYLILYSAALKQVRATQPNSEQFSNGM